MKSTANSQASKEKWVLLTTVLASAMAFIDATALNVALPAIQSQLHATGTELLWIVNAYAVVTAALILFGGALGDGFGRGRVFGIGIGLFVIASLGCGVSATTHSLIIARVFQGFGAALMIPGSLSLISTTFEPSRRGRAIGIWSACSVVMSCARTDHRRTPCRCRLVAGDLLHQFADRTALSRCFVHESSVLS